MICCDKCEGFDGEWLSNGVYKCSCGNTFTPEIKDKSITCPDCNSEHVVLDKDRYVCLTCHWQMSSNFAEE